MRLLFEGGFYSRAAFIGEFTVFVGVGKNGKDKTSSNVSCIP